MFERTPLYAESWNVAIRKTNIGLLLEDRQTPFKIIKNDIRYWAADPFVVEHNGKVFIFAELYDYILCRGVVGYCTMVEGKLSKWKPIIKEDYHLSYPCIIKDKDSWYIIPESGEGNELAIYEAIDFPEQWRKKKVIRQNVKFADTTPFPDNITGKALTHCVENPENPRLVLINLSGDMDDSAVNAKPFRSRPAGHMFMYDNVLIRPAQFSENCGNGYGKGIIFRKCQFEDENSYYETEIKVIKPEDLNYDRSIYLDGMHTYNASEHYEVIDIKTRRFNLLNLFMRIISKIL